VTGVQTCALPISPVLRPETISRRVVARHGEGTEVSDHGEDLFAAVDRAWFERCPRSNSRTF